MEMINAEAAQRWWLGLVALVMGLSVALPLQAQDEQPPAEEPAAEGAEAEPEVEPSEEPVEDEAPSRVQTFLEVLEDTMQDFSNYESRGGFEIPWEMEGIGRMRDREMRSHTRIRISDLKARLEAETLTHKERAKIEREIEKLEKIQKLEEQVATLRKQVREPNLGLRQEWKVEQDLIAAEDELIVARRDMGVDAAQQAEIRSTLQYRHNFRDNYDFDDDRDDGDNFDYIKLFFGGNYVHSEQFTLSAEAMVSRTWGANGRENRQEEYLDLTLLYGDLKLSDDVNAPRARLGRQYVSFGKGRMVGVNRWDNFQRSFDGARLNLRSSYFGYKHDLKTSAFWLREVRVEDGQTDDDEFNNSDSNEDFLGIHQELPYNDLIQTRGAAYFYWFGDDTGDTPGESGNGETSIFTVGFEGETEFHPGLRLESEWAWQTGEFGEDDHEAWAFVADLSYAVDTEKFPLETIGVRLARASGDDDPADGEHGTFFRMFPSQHDQHGQMDLVGWQNLQEIALYADLTVLGNVRVEYHLFNLVDSADAYYNAAGVPVRRAAGGNASDDLGSELDLSWSFGEGARAGVSWFMPGEYFEDTGTDDSPFFFYFSFGH